mmetsp:Transcript_11185/g.20522  ORF Transcript_11185/g.20522 Transcript_11185/m.20522 type:complete len:260 (-) Transcript_11185:876-1655(-)
MYLSYASMHLHACDIYVRMLYKFTSISVKYQLVTHASPLRKFDAADNESNQASDRSENQAKQRPPRMPFIERRHVQHRRQDKSGGSSRHGTDQVQKQPKVGNHARDPPCSHDHKQPKHVHIAAEHVLVEWIRLHDVEGWHHLQRHREEQRNRVHDLHTLDEVVVRQAEEDRGLRAFSEGGVAECSEKDHDDSQVDVRLPQHSGKLLWVFHRLLDGQDDVDPLKREHSNTEKERQSARREGGDRFVHPVDGDEVVCEYHT